MKADYLEGSGVHEESADLVSGGSLAVYFVQKPIKYEVGEYNEHHCSAKAG